MQILIGITFVLILSYSMFGASIDLMTESKSKKENIEHTNVNA